MYFLSVSIITIVSKVKMLALISLTSALVGHASPPTKCRHSGKCIIPLFYFCSLSICQNNKSQLCEYYYCYTNTAKKITNVKKSPLSPLCQKFLYINHAQVCLWKLPSSIADFGIFISVRQCWVTQLPSFSLSLSLGLL